jgi:hypothetical protein
MAAAKIENIYGLNQSIQGTEPGFIDFSANQNTFVRDQLDKKLYIGNEDGTLNEVISDKSHNWAKTFFYGGS